MYIWFSFTLLMVSAELYNSSVYTLGSNIIVNPDFSNPNIGSLRF